MTQTENKDPVRIKTIAETASIDNDGNDIDDADSNCDSISDDKALVTFISYRK